MMRKLTTRDVRNAVLIELARTHNITADEAHRAFWEWLDDYAARAIEAEKRGAAS